MKLLQPLPPMPAILGDRHAQFPITKASNSSHFHIPLIFLPSSFPAMQYQLLFFLFDTFFHFGNLKKCVHRRVTIPQGQHHVMSAQQS